MTEQDDKFPVVMQWTDEQTAAYVAQVEEAMASRKRSGTLLSVFDFLAAAMLPLFMAGRSNYIPAAWVFGAMHPGLLPDGVMESATTMRRALDELSLELGLLDVDGAIDEVRTLRTRIGQLAKATAQSAKWEGEKPDIEPNWDEAPKEFDWWAVDPDGTAYWYADCPEAGWMVASSQDVWKDRRIELPPSVSWHTTLRERESNA